MDDGICAGVGSSSAVLTVRFRIGTVMIVFVGAAAFLGAGCVRDALI